MITLLQVVGITTSKILLVFPNVGSQKLEHQKIKPLAHPDFAKRKSLLHSIRKKDIMIHLPYQSFEYLVDYLREAAIDPQVTSIKMTIYRLAKGSKVVNALESAAANGKNVKVVIELQARF